MSNKVHPVIIFISFFSRQDNDMNAFFLIDGYIDSLIFDFEVSEYFLFKMEYLFLVVVLARLGNFAIHFIIWFWEWVIKIG